MKTIDTIRVECSCGERAELPLELAGRRVRCTVCKAKIRVQGPSTESRRVYRTGEARQRSRRDFTRSDDHKARRQAMRKGSTQRPSPYAPPKAPLARAEATASSSGSSSKRLGTKKTKLRRDRAGEAHVQAMGIWHRVTAVILLGLTAFLLLNPQGQGTELLAGVLLCGGAFSWWLGTSLMRFQRWARNFVGVTTALAMCKTVLGILLISSGIELLNVVVAGMWQVATLWVLFGGTSATVFHDDYPEPDHEPVEWSKSPFFWLPIATAMFGGFTIYLFQ
jgi:hypothetical protein